MVWYSAGKEIVCNCNNPDKIKNGLIYNNNRIYMNEYKKLELVINNIKESNGIYNLKYGFSFGCYHDMFYDKKLDKFVPVYGFKNPENLVLEGEDFIKFIDLLLEIFGFKEIIKDYVIVTSIRLLEDLNKPLTEGGVEKYINYSFEVLFNIPQINNVYDNKNRFNLLFFEEDKHIPKYTWDSLDINARKKHFNYYIKYIKCFNFLDVLLNENLIPNIKDQENFKKNYLNKKFLKQKELEVEQDLLNFYFDKKNHKFSDIPIGTVAPLTYDSDLDAAYNLGMIGEPFNFGLYEYNSEDEAYNRETKFFKEEWKVNSWYKFAERWEVKSGLKSSEKWNCIICNFAVKGFGNYENMFNTLE